jgi:N-methylhydantoinase B
MSTGHIDRVLREVDALADDEPVRAGEVIRIRTTGGGGWGDPLERDPAAVADDVRNEKVGAASAREHYAVVLAGDGSVDVEATEALRASRRS